MDIPSQKTRKEDELVEFVVYVSLIFFYIYRNVVEEVVVGM